VVTLFAGASEATEMATAPGEYAVVFRLKIPCVNAEEIVAFPATGTFSDDVGKCDIMNVRDGSANK
jgi:hypothetical protein